MKVKDLLMRYRMSSNADVMVVFSKEDGGILLTKKQVAHLEPKEVMDMTMTTFDVVDGVLTVYAYDPKRR